MARTHRHIHKSNGVGRAWQHVRRSFGPPTVPVAGQHMRTSKHSNNSRWIDSMNVHPFQSCLCAGNSQFCCSMQPLSSMGCQDRGQHYFGRGVLHSRDENSLKRLCKPSGMCDQSQQASTPGAPAVLTCTRGNNCCRCDTHHVADTLHSPLQVEVSPDKNNSRPQAMRGVARARRPCISQEVVRVSI
jgi:hypothetical protein